MKLEKVKLMTVVILCIVLPLALLQVSCKKKGKCSAKCDSNGNCQVECSVEFEFDSAQAPRTAKGQFDQILVFDLNKNYSISDKVSLNVICKTDKGFTKSGRFLMQKDKARKVPPVRSDFVAYPFVPENKNLMDNFFREILSNTNQKFTSTIIAKFAIKSTDIRLKQVILSSRDLSLRAKLTLEESLGPLPVPWTCCQ